MIFGLPSTPGSLFEPQTLQVVPKVAKANPVEKQLALILLKSGHATVGGNGLDFQCEASAR